ncbi:DUF6129 family protein [Bradyrhizobium sp. WSM1417]|uniref:DUF6129 family protein n=1 Tax=Bradyrhizobium sp. WSM1417 TaxID=754500 RepID=UPI00047F937F|nr:DUF6129 family protein [Bradyrhizobium sp. WSM1417]
MVLEGELTNIERTLAAIDTASEPCLTLRQNFPHLAWISCDASDITQTPCRRLGQFELHLLDTSGHCAQITNDPQRATGIVLAKRSGSS